MSETRSMLRVGLTGGIAAGKSTVAQMLTDLGAFVLDADRIAHDSMEPGAPAFEGVIARFGRELLDEEGRLVRSQLARRVFADPVARRALNDIVHPEVRAEVARRLAAEAGHGQSPITVLDAALLVETGDYRDFDRLIVVRCSTETQLRRLVLRGLTEEEARARLGAQAPLTQKLAVADYVIDTDGALDATRRQVEAVYAKLLEDPKRRVRK